MEIEKMFKPKTIRTKQVEDCKALDYKLGEKLGQDQTAFRKGVI